MDLVFEYEAAFGPVEGIPWAKFLAGVERTGRFTARQLYAAIVGPTFALSSLSSDGVGERMQVQAVLEDAAFGTHRPLIIQG